MPLFYCGVESFSGCLCGEKETLLKFYSIKYMQNLYQHSQRGIILMEYYNNKCNIKKEKMPYSCYLYLGARLVIILLIKTSEPQICKTEAGSPVLPVPRLGDNRYLYFDYRLTRTSNPGGISLPGKPDRLSGAGG